MSGTDGDTETSEQQSQHKPGNITLDRQVSDSQLETCIYFRALQVTQ